MVIAFFCAVSHQLYGNHLSFIERALQTILGKDI